MATVRPIDGFDLEVHDSALVLLLGASGCGKTTRLSAMASLLTPAAGHVHLDHVDVTALTGRAGTAYRRSTVGLVFQAFNLLGSLTALDNVAMPLWSAGIPGRTARARTLSCWSSWGWETASTTGRRACRAASSSARPSPAPWRPSPGCCWPTSRPPISTSSRRGGAAHPAPHRCAGPDRRGGDA